MKIRCLIADDEPLARDLITSYVHQVDGLEVAGICSNALDVFSFLQRNAVDLVFLDIQMPKMSGLELVRSLHLHPKIVFTTAFREFAAEGYELDVLDYLVKPVSFERFLKALGKYHQLTSAQRMPEPEKQENDFDTAYMYFKVNKESVKVFLRDILYIESLKDYIKVVTPKTQYLTYQRLSLMEEKLPEDKFMRIHKSYIIAFGKIKSYSSEAITIDSVTLPIGRLFRQSVFDRVNPMK